MTEKYVKRRKLDTNLEKLDASYDSEIDDNMLKDLNLVELNASGNPKITKINHLKKLKILDASLNSGINNESL